MYRAGIVLLALTLAPSAALAQQPCTTDARHVVNELYRHMLERQADASSAHWVEQLENGDTVRSVVREIATSDEHVQRFWRQEPGEDVPYVRAVGVIYRHILGRQPDEPGARTWALQAARNGLDSVVDRIVNSAEYDRQFGDWGVPGSGGLRYCARTNEVATTGDFIRVDATQPWTDTGLTVRAGDTITFDPQGTVRIGYNRNDVAGAGGTLSGRRDQNAPLPNRVAGALIARIGSSPPLFIGNRRSVRAPFDGRLYLGINDNYLDDNSGDLQVTVSVADR